MSTPEFTGDTLGRVRELALFELLKLRLLRQIPVAAPGAGAQFSLAVPGGVVWELVTVTARLVSSAVVGQRTLGLTFTDPDGNLAGGGITAAGQAASQTVNYAFAPNSGYGAVAAVNVGLCACTATPLLPGFVLASLVTNMDVGDQLSRVVVTVREWSAQQIAAQSAWIARQQAVVSD